ncbi:NmrA family transcriptional regulator [Dissophora ornata]|nr:NmrA family transcriptional regulator [Dissophora ornata]
MTNILVIFGATGQQGGSVANYVLNDPELSKQFHVRAVTRDPSKPVAQALQKNGAEVVKGDADDKDSIKQALHGAHTVFIITTTTYDDQLRPREFAQGKTIADTAVAAGLQYIIFSTLPNAGKISGGKYQHLDHFDVKYDIEQYIRSLPIKSAFFAPGFFMQNFGTVWPVLPVGDGTYAISNIVTPDTKVALIETVSDSGKYVGAILAEPDKYEGKTFSAATSLYSYEEIVQAISKATGKTVKYNQLPVSVFHGFLPPSAADYLVDMSLYLQDFGTYGPQTEELVGWSAQNARGKVTTLEEYLVKNPIQLQ